MVTLERESGLTLAVAFGGAVVLLGIVNLLRKGKVRERATAFIRGGAVWAMARAALSFGYCRRLGLWCLYPPLDWLQWLAPGDILR